MKRTSITMYGLVIMVTIAHFSNGYELDMTKLAKKLVADSVSCRYYDDFRIDGVCDNVYGGSCSLNYSTHEEDASLWKRQHRYGDVSGLPIYTQGCLTLIGTAINKDQILGELIVTLNDPDTAKARDYLVFRIIKDEYKSYTNITINNPEELISYSMRSSDGKFGGGFFIFTPKADTNSRVLLFYDPIVLSSALIPEWVTSKPKTCPIDFTPESTIRQRNCYVEQTGFNDGDVFWTTIRYNYALWTFLLLMLIFFIITLGAEPDVPLNFQNKNGEKGSFHPLGSVLNFGYDCFTKTSRWALIFLTLECYSVANGFIVMIFHPDNTDEVERLKFKGWNILTHHIIPIVASIIASTIITYIMGAILAGLRKGHMYYIGKYEKIKEAKGSNIVQLKDELEDEYETIRANWNFLFYILGTVIFIAAGIANIWFHAKFHNDYKLVWLANFFICIILDLIILDLIVMLIAGAVPALGKIVNIRGFHYDYQMQERYSRLHELD